MIKVLNLYYPGRLFVLLASENVLILAGLWVAAIARAGSFRGSATPFHEALIPALIISLICQTCLYYCDLYDLRFLSSWREILGRLLQAVGSAALIIAIILAIFPERLTISASIVNALVVTILLLFVWRVFVEWCERAYVRDEKIILVGEGHPGDLLVRELEGRSDVPIKIAGIITEDSSTTANSDLHAPWLGNIQNLKSILEAEKPNRVIVSLRERRNRLPVADLLSFRLRGVIVQDANALYENLTGRISVENVQPSELLFTDGYRRSSLRTAWEFLSRVIGGTIGLILSAPLIALVWIAVKLDSPGPAFYSQERIGLNRKIFRLYKFRSMYTDAEARSGPTWASQSDPRVTRVGKFIRKVRFDELPQFFNIIRGDMNFVGPRPERPHFVELLSREIPYYDLRHTVRPGLTGWAQVRCSYGASVRESCEKLQFDIFYMKHASISLDCLILFTTIKTMIFGRGAR